MATGGAMTRSVKDLELVYRATFGPPSTDQNIAPLPYREVELPKKLKFGYYTSGNIPLTGMLHDSGPSLTPKSQTATSRLRQPVREPFWRLSML